MTLAAIAILASMMVNQSAIAPARGTGALAVPPSSGTLITSANFGLHTLSAGNAKTPLITGYQMVRSINVDSYILFNWANLNPSSGTFNFGTQAGGGSAGSLENWVQSELALGYQIDMSLTGSATDTPAWAMDGDGGPNLTAYAAWCSALATRFAGRIKYYEVWNEPNGPGNWPRTNADLVTLEQTAYTTIKAIDPSAIILGPAWTEQGGISSGTVNATGFMAAGGGTYMDIFAMHTYDGDAGGPTVENMYAMIQAYQALTIHPMMSTEGSWGFGATPVTNPTAQSNFVSKMAVVCLMTNLKSMIWYAQDIATGDGGLESNSTTLTSAGTAYQTTITRLSGATMTSSGIDANQTYWMKYTNYDGTHGMYVWNDAGSFSFAVPGFTTTVGLTGSPTTITGGSITATTNPQFLAGP